MLPARLAPILFGFLLSGLMSLILSGFATWRAVGVAPGFPGLWGSSWIGSWLIAFPTVLVVAPLARRLVARMTVPPGR